jgi:CheY-like chemotaxis protein
MTKKTYFIVDDDEIFNFIHSEIINLHNIDAVVTKFSSSTEALEKIKSMITEGCPLPNYILLDINMPELNGFELMDELSILPKFYFQNTKIFMVTSSLNEKDIKKAFSYELLSGFKSKPLTVEIISELS